MKKLSTAETSALRILSDHGNAMLISSVPDKNYTDEFGGVIPGVGIYKKLDRKGLVLITEEEADSEGFVFTPQIELLEPGIHYLRENQNGH